MDVKTYEYMNERTQKYKSLKNKKEEAQKSLDKLNVFNLETFYSNGFYLSIPSAIRGKLRVATKELIENNIQDLEKEMEEI